MRFAPILTLFLLSGLTSGAAVQNGPPDKKQLEAQAKQVVAEAQSLEQQGKLAEAKDKYIDAEGIVSTADAVTGISRINDEEKQQVESALADARRSYDAGKFSDSIEELQHALEIQPSNAALQYNLALCYLKLGDRANAATHLDYAISDTSKGKQQTELLELRSSVLMGVTPTSATEDSKKTLTGFNESYLQEDRDPRDTKATGGSLCEQTKELKQAFLQNAAVVFNSAKCAYEDAGSEDAARQLADYLQLVPDTLDRADAELLRQNLLSLASLSGDSGRLVRQHYATAATYLDYRRYDRAIAEYEAAEQILPDYPQTQWRLALLYEAYGNVAKAREHFSRFEQVAPDREQKDSAEFHLSNLDKGRAVYDANVSEAQDILSNLLRPPMGIDSEGVKHKTKLSYRQWRWASHRYKEATRATEKLPESYVERELNRARVDLEAAAELAPLGAEVNEMLALIYLQGNNWPEAYRSYDAVASQGFPVSFYAQINSGHDSKMVKATKVEIGSDAIQLISLATYDPKKQVSVPPDQPAGEDDLGNLIVSATQPPDAQADAITIKASDLKGVETDKNFVVLKVQNDRVYLAPLNMLSEVPFEGGASRTFGNEYTRLFARYLGYESAKLGKEGMTGGEKFKLGFQIARIGVAVGMMGIGAPAAYGSAVRMARLIHALQVYHSVAQGVRVGDAAEATTRLVDDLQMSAASLEQTISDQQRAIQATQFKVIPTQQFQLKFRDKI